MKQYFVTAILSKPKKMSHKFDHVTIEYWEVEVEMISNGEVIKSIVTFDTEEKANKLRIGDAFER